MDDAFVKDYRDWLINQVNMVNKKDYAPFLRRIFEIEYYWTIKNDEDRAMDGVALRDEYLDEIGSPDDLNMGPARLLEVLIGIARRIEFQLFGSSYMDDWGYKNIFWDMISNLGLGDMHGTLLGGDYDRIDQNVTLFLSPNKNRHKKCNIFILENSDKNLSKMNIWSQMMLYIREKWPI